MAWLVLRGQHVVGEMQRFIIVISVEPDVMAIAICSKGVVNCGWLM